MQREIDGHYFIGNDFAGFVLMYGGGVVNLGDTDRVIDSVLVSDHTRDPTTKLCAKIPFSFEVDRYNGQPANNRLTFIYSLLPEKEPPQSLDSRQR
jgi:hypothetical protein